MKFKPESDMVFDWSEKKFYLYRPKSASKLRNKNNRTFCCENKIFSNWLNNENEYCAFFNKYLPNGDNDWFWGYAYNLMFEVIDFDYDTDVWLCKVLGYIE